MIRLAIAGAAGRMGRCTTRLALAEALPQPLPEAGGPERFELVALLVAPGEGEAPAEPGMDEGPAKANRNAAPSIDNRQSAIDNPPLRGSRRAVGAPNLSFSSRLEKECDVLIDFSTAEGTAAWVDVCRTRGTAMVIGTTGHSDEQTARIREAAADIPIVQATNFSVGIQALLEVAGRLAAKLGDGFDVEIVEAHHRHKVDAPSGTALRLAEEIASATNRSLDKEAVYGRHGRVGQRPAGQIGIHAVRMGELVGWHEIHFSGGGETVTIRHEAHSRDTFAAGALRAAAWVHGRAPGLYSMRNVVE